MRNPEFNSMPSSDDINKTNADTERAQGRIPEGGVGEMSINDFIASLTDMANSPVSAEGSSDSLNKAVGMAAYLRDNFEAQAVGDIAVVLAERRVKPEVVKFWIEEEMAVNPREFDAIATG